MFGFGESEREYQDSNGEMVEEKEKHGWFSSETETTTVDPYTGESRTVEEKTNIFGFTSTNVVENDSEPTCQAPREDEYVEEREDFGDREEVVEDRDYSYGEDRETTFEERRDCFGDESVETEEVRNDYGQEEYTEETEERSFF